MKFSSTVSPSGTDPSKRMLTKKSYSLRSKWSGVELIAVIVAVFIVIIVIIIVFIIVIAIVVFIFIVLIAVVIIIIIFIVAIIIVTVTLILLLLSIDEFCTIFVFTDVKYHHYQIDIYCSSLLL